jgi:ubiquinone/menaquinone biosynthesis C-methylase UbiE
MEPFGRSAATGVPEDPLELAIAYYYWKPMAALIRAIEMQVYAQAGLRLRGPLLDLGCGDGRVALMLQRLEIADHPFCGLEHSPQELAKARALGRQAMLVRGDAKRLPFGDEGFASITCNNVLGSMPGGIEDALVEIARVLRKDGLFVATVPTDRFIDVLLWPGLLERVSPALRDHYISRINRRLPHFTALPRDEWQRRFARHGLQVIRCEEFFSRRTGRLWSILALQICRTFAVLKPLNNHTLTGAVSTLWRRLFAPVSQDDRKAGGPFGYMFMVARKNSQ